VEDNDLHVGPGGIPLGGIAGNFDVLLPEVLGRGAGQVIDLTSDIDDETMVELAIALSLQDQGEGGGELENIRQVKIFLNLCCASPLIFILPRVFSG